jgi:hypothetical protein
MSSGEFATVTAGIAIVSALLSLALPAMASADTYCVNKPTCAGAVQPTVPSALDAAKAHPGDDVVEIARRPSLTSAHLATSRTP